ncbi:nitronate monooxygenase [Streptomyces sp. 2A115]|uniref:nitronate monooxygenase n=1 Tax=Streptomyces sp. 2A115 TaxID=3457439 RepID=UPI003FD0B189
MSWPTGRGEAASLAPTRHSACHRCSFGGPSVTSTEGRESVRLPGLVAAVHHAVALPVIAAGGIATAADVTAVLRAGAVAAMVGTALLRTQGSGTDRGLDEQAGRYGWSVHPPFGSRLVVAPCVISDEPPSSGILII